MTGTDGTACARLPVFPSGFPPSDPFSCPRPPPPPRPPPCCLMHVFGAQHVRRCACSPGVFTCVRVACSIREMKFKRYTKYTGEKDPGGGRIGGEGDGRAVYDKALKIHSINRRWTRSRRGRA